MNGFPEFRDGLIGGARRGTALEIDDAGAQQFIARLRGMASDSPRHVHRPQAFGLSSVPPAGSEGILLALGGRSDRLLGLGFEHKDHRPKGSASGTAVLYDDKGNLIFAKGGDGVIVTVKQGKIELTNDDGDVVVTAAQGKITVKPGTGKNVYLGGDGVTGTYALVSTVSGPAINVLARIG